MVDVALPLAARSKGYGPPIVFLKIDENALVSKCVPAVSRPGGYATCCVTWYKLRPRIRNQMSRIASCVFEVDGSGMVCASYAPVCGKRFESDNCSGLPLIDHQPQSSCVLTHAVRSCPGRRRFSEVCSTS